MVLIFGCGYLGSRAARLWRAAGHDVTIVTRSGDKAERLRSEGYRAIIADVCNPATLGELPDADTVLFAVGYDRKVSERPIHDVYAGGVRNVLHAIVRSADVPSTQNPEPRTQNFIFISSTGVYGDVEGDWVDESTPCRPTREGGRACLAAEQAIANHPLGARSIVLRAAGIYGPDRIPRANALRREEPIDAPADGRLNLIHVDDLAQIVVDVDRLARDRRIELPRTFCVSDGHPIVRREYYEELARLLAAPPPRFVDPAAACMAVRRAAADKRVSNARLLAEVKPTLAYPSFREGLRAITSEPNA